MTDYPRDELHAEFAHNKPTHSVAYTKAVTGDGSHEDPWIPLHGEGVSNFVSNRVDQIALGGTQLAGSPLIQGIELKAWAGNSGNVYIGGSGSTTEDGYPLAATDTLFVRIDDTNLIFISAEGTGNRMYYAGS